MVKYTLFFVLFSLFSSISQAKDVPFLPTPLLQNEAIPPMHPYSPELLKINNFFNLPQTFKTYSFDDLIIQWQNQDKSAGGSIISYAKPQLAIQSLDSFTYFTELKTKSLKVCPSLQHQTFLPTKPYTYFFINYCQAPNSSKKYVYYYYVFNTAHYGKSALWILSYWLYEPSVNLNAQFNQNILTQFEQLHTQILNQTQNAVIVSAQESRPQLDQRQSKIILSK